MSYKTIQIERNVEECMSNFVLASYDVYLGQVLEGFIAVTS